MRSLLVASLSLLTAACGSTYMDAPGGADGISDVARSLSPAEEALALHAANQLDLETLDAELDVRAANGIVDGRPFLDIDSLDAVSYVGATALVALADLGVEHFGTVPHGAQDIPSDTLTLWAANELDQVTLDDVVGLDRRAAENIVAARPFATVADLDAVSYVGPSALGDLEAYGAGVFGTTCEAGTLLHADGTTYASLLEALGYVSGEHDLIACAGTFYGPRPLLGFDGSDVAIYGFGAGQTTFDGMNEERFLATVEDGDMVTLYGATFRRAFDLLSPVAVYSGDLQLLATSFEDNSASSGGAVQGGHVTAIRSTFAGNVASWRGGAIDADGATLVDCVFDDNHVEADGDGSAFYVQGDLRVEGSSLTNHSGPSVVFWDAFGTDVMELSDVTYGTATDANLGVGLRVRIDFDATADHDLEGTVSVSCSTAGCD